eukprot:jgi/Hompol1/5312/HPOL_004325-RA
MTGTEPVTLQPGNNAGADSTHTRTPSGGAPQTSSKNGSSVSPQIARQPTGGQRIGPYALGKTLGVGSTVLKSAGTNKRVGKG